MILQRCCSVPLVFLALFNHVSIGYASTADPQQVCVATGDGNMQCIQSQMNSNGQYEDHDCFDENPKCEAWAKMGECPKNPNYMLHFCRKSCLSCGLPGTWGEAQVRPNEATMEVLEPIHRVMRMTDRYMLDKVYVDEYYNEVREDCANRHEQCAFWASLGECDANPDYMRLHCAPSCQTCEHLDMAVRCPFNASIPKAWDKPGDLNRMFRRLASDPYYEQYEPVVHSMPMKQPIQNFDQVQHYKRSLVEMVQEEEIEKQIIAKHSGAIKDGPWVLTLENFLTEEECDTLIRLGGDRGYEQSYDVGKKNFDGTHDKALNEGRTSTNAWCQDACYEHPVTKRIFEKMTNVTGIPERNTEYLQLLRYESTQRYTPHHDYIPHQVRLEPGPRILTLYMYLSDVDAGGGTDFPDLGITVMPKKGKALLWPSVFDESPLDKDERTMHQALPVERGLKFGANAWYHSRDYKTSMDKGCVG